LPYEPNWPNWPNWKLRSNLLRIWYTIWG
jgi:hypothetical protein